MQQHDEVPDDVSIRLAALDDQPVEEHVAVYDELHRDLRDQLVDGATQNHSAPRPHP